MSTIFLSYRRDDSAATCGRVYERLATHFGRDAVFKDVDDIPYGVRFPDYLAERLRACRVVLVIIGRQWLTLTTPDGARRLDAPGDFVRTEIETGLRSGLIAVPVLVDNASMPHPEELPESIRELVKYNGAQVRYDPDFDTDMQRLIRQLERWLGVFPSAASAPPVGASGGRPPISASAPTPAPTPPPVTSADPQANAVADLLLGIRAAAAQRDWPRVLDKADALLSEAPEATPDEIYRVLGEARYEMGDFARARQALDIALAHGQPDVPTWTLAARICLRTNDPAAAEGHLKRALARVDAPAERLPLLRDYADALIALQQWDELLRRADEGARLAPDDASWLRTRLRALTELHRDADALTVLRTVTARPDASAADWLARARLASAVIGESDAADAEISAALDAAARLAVANDPAITQARRELLPPPPPKSAPPPNPPVRSITLPADHLPVRLVEVAIGFAAYEREGAAFILPPVCTVPSGSFQMGSDPKRERDARHDNNPLRTATTSAFQIARYPVTVAEYACFVRAGKHGSLGWQDQFKAKLDHSVVYVSWHDATAYAAWLAHLSGQPWRLPSEEEWEKAARWDPRSGTSRVYPWGDSFDKTRCNTGESVIGTTTPVGKYGASGASPTGAEDLAGNVWEWTNSTWDNSANNRVRRGGAWSNSARDARAAYRAQGWSYDFSGDIGFRLVVAPSLRAGSV